MNIIPYEDLSVTTITLVMSLNGSVNTELAFFLLPITWINISQIRESVKCKIPRCKLPGSILSMRYQGNVRGIIRSKSSSFKNAVTIDISTSKKNISLKLSSYSIQMCGASSKDDGFEAASHLIDHLVKIQRILDKIQNDMSEALEIVKWVKNNTRGEKTEKTIQEQNGVLTVNKKIEDFFVVKPDVLIPDYIDKEIAMFLLSMTNEFLYHNDMCQKLDFIMKIDEVIKEPLEIKHIDEAMVNYNYSLGFEVDRDNLDLHIDNVNGFISRYNNALTTSVKIELPYDPPPGTEIKRRKNKIPHHTFLVYRSGSVTQSGPGGELMRDAYYLFMQTISDILRYIKYISTTPPQNVCTD